MLKAVHVNPPYRLILVCFTDGWVMMSAGLDLQDVDFGEGEDFDETPAEGGPKEDTEVEKETATASDDNTQAAWEAPPADVTAEHTAPDAGGGAAEEAVTGDVLMTDPKTKSPEVADANGVGTADEAAAADGDEAVASKR